MSARLRGQQGFALIEMLVAIVVINVGLLVILLALTSGMTTLRRSAQTSTASAVADKQLERYRAVALPSIFLDTTALAATDSTYRAQRVLRLAGEPGVRSAHAGLHPDADGQRARRALVPRRHVHRLGHSGRGNRRQAGDGRRAHARKHRPARAGGLDRGRRLLDAASGAPQERAGRCRYGQRMASFAYSAINALGAESAGQVSAPDVGAARELLRQRGLRPLTLTEVGAAGSAGRARRKVKARSLQVFSRQFATMIEAGLSVVQSLVILEQQTDDRALAEVVREVRSDVESGMLLSQAMARHPKVFDRLYVAMIEAGEAAGILDTVLDRVAVQIEKEMKIRRRVKGAMVYPMVVLTFAILTLIGMLLFLVPVFEGIFSDLGGDLPTLTKGVVAASDLVRGYWFILFPAIGGAVYGFRRWKQTPAGKQVWDRLKLRLPAGIGKIVLKVTMARFSRTLATLVAAGVDIIKALEIAGQTAGNWVVESALADVRAKVHQGVPIAQPLIENPVFPPLVSQMVKVGEETGELEKMLDKIADFYEDEVDTSIASLTSIVEPLMMIGVGAIIGVIVISMYLPMFKLLQLVQ